MNPVRAAAPRFPLESAPAYGSLADPAPRVTVSAADTLTARQQQLVADSPPENVTDTWATADPESREGRWPGCPGHIAGLKTG